MSFAKSLKAEQRRAVLAPDGRIYILRRVNAGDLAEHRWVELQAANDAARALVEMQREQGRRHQVEQLKGLPPEEREAAAAKLLEQDAYNEQLAQQKALEGLTRSPAAVAQHEARINAYVCAGVVGGLSHEDTEAHLAALAGPKKGGPKKGQKAAAAPQVGPLDALPAMFDAVSFVLLERDEDVDAGRLWVGNIDGGTRGWLCGHVSHLSQNPLGSFRGRAGDGGDA